MLLHIAPKILVVDDHDLFRSVLTKALRLSNYRVVQADNGPTCLFVARQEQPDLILLDLVMSGQDGFTTCQQLRTDPTTSHIPILALSAWSEPRVKARILAAGANAFLEKPFSTAELEEKIEDLLQKKAPTSLSLRLGQAVAPSAMSTSTQSA
ncbi:MAG: response regulator [Anaerolineae bacterium]|jgi:two-component system cell cycle response regulator|nr:response regulator [Anaerolineae bacterium]MDH7473082.1 response regulator [Anaerolineae bacterium]